MNRSAYAARTLRPALAGVAVADAATGFLCLAAARWWTRTLGLSGSLPAVAAGAPLLLLAITGAATAAASPRSLTLRLRTQAGLNLAYAGLLAFLVSAVDADPAVTWATAIGAACVAGLAAAQWTLAKTDLAIAR